MGQTIEQYDGGLTNLAIGAAIEVHKALGPGLLESACEAYLTHELGLHDTNVQRQVPLPVVYSGTSVGCRYRADKIVGGGLILGRKSVRSLLPVHEAPLLT